MSKRSTPPSTPPAPVPLVGRPETKSEQQLRDWFAGQRLAAPDNLEKMAREIIALITTLLGLLLGVLVIADPQLPHYLAHSAVRVIGGTAVVIFLLALGAALVVVYPFPWRHANTLAEEAQSFQTLLQRKHNWLRVSTVLFGTAMGLVGVVLLLAMAWA